MSRPLLLVAASGLAREVLDTVRAAGGPGVIGLLDDNPQLHGTVLGGAPVLGPPEAAADHPDADVVLCAGRGGTRAVLAERLAGVGVGTDRYGTVVHPRASVGPSCTVGAGSILLAGVVLTADVSAGRHLVVMPNAVLTHDDALDDAVTVCAGVCLAGGVRVGRAAYLGAGSLVRERLSVGAQAVLGMGAVVVRDVPAGEVWVGNPAKRLEVPARAVYARC